MKPVIEVRLGHIPINRYGYNVYIELGKEERNHSGDLLYICNEALKHYLIKHHLGHLY